MNTHISINTHTLMNTHTHISLLFHKWINPMHFIKNNTFITLFVMLNNNVTVIILKLHLSGYNQKNTSQFWLITTAALNYGIWRIHPDVIYDYFFYSFVLFSIVKHIVNKVTISVFNRYGKISNQIHTCVHILILYPLRLT